MSHDEISNPKHYDLFPGMQAIDVIEAALTPEEFAGYLKGNALKYRLRAGDKGPADKCLAKARWYQDYLRNIVAADAASQACLDWPNEQRRQDAAASQPRIDSGPMWVEWRGGASPTHSATFVEVRMRDGEKEDGHAGAFGWSHRGEPTDIVAWRESWPEEESYTGQGGVMIQCPGCVATSCECRP